MIDKFWNMYVDFKIAEYYYAGYSLASKRIDGAISAICLLASASSISAWYIWDKFPVIWIIIIGISQVLSVCKPLLPYAKRVSAAEYILQDLRPLIRDIDTKWGFDGSGISDEEFRQLIQTYEGKRDDIEGRFASSHLFPENLKIHDKAQKSAIQYFKSRFYVEAVEKPFVEVQ